MRKQVCPQSQSEGESGCLCGRGPLSQAPNHERVGSLLFQPHDPLPEISAPSSPAPPAGCNPIDPASLSARSSCSFVMPAAGRDATQELSQGLTRPPNPARDAPGNFLMPVGDLAGSLDLARCPTTRCAAAASRGWAWQTSLPCPCPCRGWRSRCDAPIASPRTHDASWTSCLWRRCHPPPTPQQQPADLGSVAGGTAATTVALCRQRSRLQTPPPSQEPAACSWLPSQSSGWRPWWWVNSPSRLWTPST
jgi:hypothetical protein